jgi:hypothetical protein
MAIIVSFGKGAKSVFARVNRQPKGDQVPV